MAGPPLRRMRFRVLAAWFAQGAVALGIVLSAVAGAATGTGEWSSIAVLLLLFAGAMVAWLRFAFGIPLIVLDILFALLGLGVAAVDPGGSTPADLVRRFVGGLWPIGGIVGAVALIASTSRGDRPTDDVDTTSY
jgi:hypothetical protein